ncbi:MAG TPA: 30S ribosomal protein S17e [archaeon]|nr:30S ribosomal protein S17e [archaeon]
MGKAVPQQIKSKANLLLQTYPNEIPKDFDSVKKFVDSFKMPLSKSQRNLIAGFIARKKAKAASS